MSDNYVVTLGAVKKDGTPDITNILFSFPAPHMSMTVPQGVRIDEEKVKGISGSIKQASGWDDTKIDIQLTLSDENDFFGPAIYNRIVDGSVTKADPLTAVEQFQILQKAFRDRAAPIGTANAQPDSNAKDVPRVYSINSRLTNIVGVKTVVFSGLTPSESPGTNDLNVTISFTEFEPFTAQADRRKKESERTAAALAAAGLARESADVKKSQADGKTETETGANTSNETNGILVQAKDALNGGRYAGKAVFD